MATFPKSDDGQTMPVPLSAIIFMHAAIYSSPFGKLSVYWKLVQAFYPTGKPQAYSTSPGSMTLSSFVTAQVNLLAAHDGAWILILWLFHAGHTVFEWITMLTIQISNSSMSLLRHVCINV